MVAIENAYFKLFGRDIGGIGVQEAAVMQNVDPAHFWLLVLPAAPTTEVRVSTD
jgi:hypothetical protein